MALADRTIQMYDQQGERAMINFLIDNQDLGTPQDMPESMGSYPLADDSGIEPARAATRTSRRSSTGQ